MIRKSETKNEKKKKERKKSVEFAFSSTQMRTDVSVRVNGWLRHEPLSSLSAVIGPMV